MLWVLYQIPYDACNHDGLPMRTSLIKEMTGDVVTISRIVPHGLHLTALPHGHRTAGMESTALRGVKGRRHIAGEQHTLLGFTLFNRGHGRQQSLGVGMFRLGKQLLGFPEFRQPTKIHYHHAVAQVTDHAEIV
jgi:hypothetical protein